MSQLNFRVPVPNGVLNISIAKGSPLFLLGANGCGKSGLITKLSNSQQTNTILKISAHRPTTFATNGIQFSQSDINSYKLSLDSVDRQSTSRWKDDYQPYRVSIALNNLIEAENKNAREFKIAAISGNDATLNRLRQSPSPLENLNEIFRRSGMPIEISIDDDQKFLAKKNGSGAYSIAQLSDGERTAIILIADILTAKPDTLIIVDEPERNLHRSIVSPLVSTLISMKRDCYFIIATHDINLAVDNYESNILLIRSCSWQSNDIHHWDVDYLSNSDEIDPSVKRALLGSEKRILFVEGEESSLDHSIYKTMFPNVTVISKGSCGNVIQAVKGMTSTQNINWIDSYGLIDRDDRSDASIQQLKEQKIYTLPSHSIESLYYCDEVIEYVARKISATTGLNVTTALENIKAQVIRQATAHAPRLSARICERKIRDSYTFPSFRSIQEGEIINLTIDTGVKRREEEARLQEFITAGSTNEIIGRYPMRETALFGEVARELQLPTRAHYEQSVRNLLAKEEELRTIIAQKLGELFTILNSSSMDAAMPIPPMGTPQQE
jgi:ABC-type cobalamin/Fe3+-siderophores transport system ATPase subunit